MISPMREKTSDLIYRDGSEPVTDSVYLDSSTNFTTDHPPHDADAARATKSFAVCCWLAISIYTAFIFYFSFAYWRSSYLVRDLSNVVLLPGLSLLLYAYWRGHKLLQDHPSVGPGRVFLYAIGVALAATCIPNFYSSDLFSYINFGWQQAQYHLNPYSHLLIATPNFPSDRMFTDVWSLAPCLYGFTFAHLSRVVCELSGGNRGLAICLFKALNFSVYLGLGGIVYFGAKKLGDIRADISVYLWLFNPLVLLHALAHAHNDIIMAFFLMSSFLSALTGPFTLVIPFLVAGILTKYLCLLATPFILIYVGKTRGLKSTVASTAIAAVLCATISWSYVQEWTSFRWIEMKGDFGMNINSLTALTQQLGCCIEKLFWHQKNAVFERGLEAVLGSIRLTCGSIFLGLMCLFTATAIKKGRNYSMQNCLQFCLIAMMVSTSFVSPRFYPWYILMYFPIALWLPEKSEWRRLAITLTCTQLFAVTFIGHGHVNNFLLLTCVPFAISIWRWLNRGHNLARERS
jgi:hypothetical protein